MQVVNARGRRLVRLILACAVLATPLSAPADGRSDHERARQAYEAGEVMPLRALLAQIERDYPGQVLEVELEREDGVWIYEVKLLRDGGDVLELELGARDGEMLGIKGRDVRPLTRRAEVR